MSQATPTTKRRSLKERVQGASRRQWIWFGVIGILYLAFVIWDQNYWLLLGLPVVFDIYVSKFIPWGAWKQAKNPTVRKIAEWVDAIVFALIAVYFINVFIFQNYKIPSSSLEKTLLVGDYLFVSKVSYGPRVPNTPLSFPLAQHTLPIINTKSYIEWPQWPYKRLAGLGEVKRNDIVVFNYPAGDTVLLKVSNPDYYYFLSNYGRDALKANEEYLGKVAYRPVDRRENYVKRCVGMPGDNFQIIDTDIYINGAKQETPKYAQFLYLVETHGSFFSERQFRQLNVSKADQQLAAQEELAYLELERRPDGSFNPVYRIPLTREAVELIRSNNWAKSIRRERQDSGHAVFPSNYHPLDTGWSTDNFGPLWIPKKGESIELNERNIALYDRCIVNYEGNTLRREDNRYFINDKPAVSYTFQYDYYFMMGDNRHLSSDSRSFGFVPEDHIVGKPLLIWLSLDPDRGLFDGGIRWKRLFRQVDAN